MRNRVEDRRADVAALEPVVELGPSDNGIAMTPGRDVFLVVEEAGAPEGAAAPNDTRRLGPGLSPVCGMRYHHVRVDTAEAGLAPQESQGGQVCRAVRIEGNGRVTGGRIVAELDRVHGPGRAAVEGDVGTRVDGLEDVSTGAHCELVIVGAADLVLH